MEKSFKITNFTIDSLDSFVDKINRMFKYRDDEESIKINLWIDSNGGETAALYGMMDYLTELNIPICTFNLGRALSAGAALLAFGTKGDRWVSPNSHTMIHGTQLSIPNNQQVAINYLRAIALQDKVHDKQFLGILDKMTDKKAGYWKRKIEKVGDGNIWLRAEDAVKEGLADHVGFPPGFKTWDI